MPWLNKHTAAIVVGVVSVVLFGFYQAIPTLPDPDSFYHAGLTALMLKYGLVSNFPWLPFTTLGQAFADHHLLYHIFLMPFVAGLGPLVGVKVAQAVLAAAFTLVCYGVLKRWRVPYAGLAVVALYSVYPMLIRINLVKASAAALIVFILLLVSLVERRYLIAGILTLLYSWLHGGFMLALVLAIVIWCGQLITSRRKLLPTGIIVVTVAMLVGIAINPYFPDNLPFLWAQFFQIGVVNYRDTIEVGAEWYPFPLTELVGAISILLLGVVGVLLIIAKSPITFVRDPRLMSLVFLTVPLTVLTLRSRRFIEYLVPILWLLVCLVVLPAWQRGDIQLLWKKHVQRLGKWATVLKMYLIATVLFGMLRPYVAVVQEFATAGPLLRYQATGAYLQEHVPAGEVVFHGGWDDFPELFYYDPTHAYIVGLDPTFLYLADAELYQRWVNVSSGQDKQATAQHIRTYFHSSYVVVDSSSDRTKLMLAYLLRDPTVQEIFRDGTVRLFKLQS